ncbi:MAG: nitroreductase family protein [Halieaceae bacterium]|nr:nitroreductase family protein [Halieaceae bacterium]
MTKLVSDIDEVLTTTRAVRFRMDFDRTVEPAIIEECLRLAQSATMGSNIEDWRFIAVTSVDQKARIAAVYRHVWLKTVEEPLAAGEIDTVERLSPNVRLESDAKHRQERTLSSVKYLVDNLERVPVLVFACSSKPVPKEAMGDKASGYYGSIFPIAWSFQLACRSRGLGTVTATAIVYESKDLAKILQLPDGTHPITMIPVGYTKGLDFKPAKRLPLENILRWESWGVS